MKVVYNSSGAYSWADGCLESAETATGSVGTSFMIGSRGNELARFFNGSIAELLVFPRALDDVNRSNVEGTLAARLL